MTNYNLATRITIEPRGKDVKLRTIGWFGSEAVLDRKQIEKAIGISQIYSIDNFCNQGLPLGERKTLRCMPLFNDDPIQLYRVYIGSCNNK